MAEIVNRTARRGAAGLVPLAQRARWVTGMRVALAVVTTVLWWLLPELHRSDPSGLPLLGFAFLVSTVVPLLATRAGRGLTLVALNGSLVVDGAALAYLLHLFGGLTGPVPVVIALHVSAVSLLVSFRTGVKVAVWQSLAVLVALQCEAAGLVPAPETGGWSLRGYLGFAVAISTAAVLTSAFAAVNERELRRRRLDAEVLRALALTLETTADPREIATALARIGVEELGARRAVVIVADEYVVAWPDAQTDSFPATGSSLLARALADNVPMLTRRPDPVGDAALLALLPGAGTVVVLPLPVGSGSAAWLVLDVGRRRRVEHRLVETLVQAGAHTGLALARAALVERLRRAAGTDGLTGAANRRTFDEVLEQQVAQADQFRPVSVALVDLDHFKQVNDTHGHQVGDEVLRCAALALQSVVRTGDLVARYGGEEFAVVLDGDAADAVELAERLRAAVAASGAPVPITCSIGVATTRAVGTEPADLLRSADEALYRAKDRGRNRVETGLSA